MNTNAFPDPLRFDEWNFAKVQSAVIQVTPAFAAQLLQKNFSTNRNIARSVVARYAREMGQGNWGVGASLSFSSEGYLVDGQHRLSAVVKAGIEVPFLITTGIPSDSYRTFDQSLQRSAAHLLTIGGGVGSIKTVTNTHISILRAMAQAMAGGESHGAVGSLMASVPTVGKLLGSVIEGIQFAAENRQGVPQSSVLAVVARAYYSRPHDKLVRFLELVGEPSLACSPDETYASRLPGVIRDRVDLSLLGATGRNYLFALTQTALIKFLTGEEWRKGRSFQPTKRVVFECPLDLEISKLTGKSVSELLRDSGSPVAGKVSKSETPEGAVVYGTTEQMIRDLLKTTCQEISRGALEEISAQERWIPRSALKSLIDGLYPDIAGVYVGHSNRQMGSASLASNLMQQVDRGEWASEFPQIKIKRNTGSPMLIGVDS